MRIGVRFVLGIILASSLALPLLAQPPRGSQLPPEENGCALCHGEPGLWKGDQQRLYVAHAALAEDVHRLHGVNCHDCHGGNPTTLDVDQAHRVDGDVGADLLPFRAAAEDAWATCGICHADEALKLRKSVHAHAQRDSQDAPGQPLSCRKCHGQHAHGLLPVKDARSPVYLNHQVRTCGGCHEEDLATYKATVHGKGLFESGLVIAAVCADCHGPHGTYYAADKRSTLFAGNVAATCGKCHEGIGELVAKSAHGHGDGPGTELGKGQAGEKWKRNPSCTDCHAGHRVVKTDSTAFRAEITSQCGNCHPDLTSSYAMSLHGELTKLGYSAAAKCSDCHGAHDILPPDDPASSLAAGGKRLATCRQCHFHAVMNFSQFDPHANHKDARQYPVLHYVYEWTHGLFLALFLFFVIHAFLWFIRSFFSVLVRGRHQTLVTGQYVLVRYTRGNRIVYLTLLISFLGLTITGLPLMFSSQHWAQMFVRAMGGFESTSVWHRFFGVVGLACCLFHVVHSLQSLWRRRGLNEKWRTILFGPDSPVPVFRDVKDMFAMGLWFIGLARKPRFERWTYWEKFDYWMAFIACLLVGTTGLAMWYPNVFCRFFSGRALNVARMMHVELAMLVASSLFVFHFFNTHFRPEKFPLDLSSITGLVSEAHLRKNRPEYVARLEATHQIESMRRPAPSRRRLWLVFVAAAVLFSIGLCLLAVALSATLGE